MIKKKIHFSPWIRSPHLQMFLAQFVPIGKPPESEKITIQLHDGDKLNCLLSTPKDANEKTPTLILIHGLGGSGDTAYLVRLARKFYCKGFRVVRVNLRGSESDEKLASRPYNAGTSDDLLYIVTHLKEAFPESPITIIGFSLGGNISIKMVGELQENAKKYIHRVIAICPTIDLYNCVQRIEKASNWIYHRYYLWYLLRQTLRWLPKNPIKSLYQYDDEVTARLWNYQNAKDYYKKCSANGFLDKVKVPCRILLAEDDPFIDATLVDGIDLPSNVEIYTTRFGGHMGYFKWSGKEHGFNWLDSLLLEWVEE